MSERVLLLTVSEPPTLQIAPPLPAQAALPVAELPERVLLLTVYVVPLLPAL